MRVLDLHIEEQQGPDIPHPNRTRHSQVCTFHSSNSYLCKMFKSGICLSLTESGLGPSLGVFDKLYRRLEPYTWKLASISDCLPRLGARVCQLLKASASCCIVTLSTNLLDIMSNSICRMNTLSSRTGIRAAPSAVSRVSAVRCKTIRSITRCQATGTDCTASTVLGFVDIFLEWSHRWRVSFDDSISPM